MSAFYRDSTVFYLILNVKSKHQADSMGSGSQVSQRSNLKTTLGATYNDVPPNVDFFFVNQSVIGYRVDLLKEGRSPRR